MAKFRIIIMDELDEKFQHFGKSEIAQEIQLRLEMLGWSVSLRDGIHNSFSAKTESKGRVLIDVLDAH